MAGRAADGPEAVVALIVAIRKSTGLMHPDAWRQRVERGDLRPAAASRVEQHPDAPVPSVHEAERDPLHALRDVVDRLSRGVGRAGAVPRQDLLAPRRERAVELADLA